jgi:hypothetical protein
MGHRDRAAVSDFAALEPLAEPDTASPWTPSVVTGGRAFGGRAPARGNAPSPAAGFRPRAFGAPPARRRLERTLPRPGEPMPALPPLPVDDPDLGGPAPPIGWRDVLRHVGTAAAIVADWLEPKGDSGPGTFTGLSPRSVTDGWPHRGSTVIRLVRAPADDVATVVTMRDRWDGLRLSGAALEPMPWDVGWSTPGRLRIRWTPLPVGVELRIQPAAGDQCWLHLLLTSRARYPRHYWTSGHEALAAIERSARRLLLRV